MELNELIEALKERADGASDFSGCLRLSERKANGSEGVVAELEYKIRESGPVKISIIRNNKKLSINVGSLILEPEAHEGLKKGYSALIEFAREYNSIS